MLPRSWRRSSTPICGIEPAPELGRRVGPAVDRPQRELVDGAHADRLQVVAVADTRKLQQLRRVDGAAGKDDFSGFNKLDVGQQLTEAMYREGAEVVYAGAHGSTLFVKVEITKEA